MNLRIFFACLFIVTSVAQAEAPAGSEQLYQQAYDSFVKRDYNAASASLDKINGVDQKKADVLNLRGAIYKRLGELDNAANAYNDALKINPKDWVPKYNLAEVNFLREQYKSSRTYLEQALASMPEADRLQKQDLILYKVYLTYLLQGDEDKAKLLLDSFDVNSANPVYYFSQAAWSFKKKDMAKAKTWVDSTEGLYSADLRNSYSQALVDVGWLEPASGVATETGTPKPSATPEMVAAASPTPVTPAAPDLVPLASSSASPVAVASPSPTATPETVAAIAPTATPSENVAAAVPSPNKPQKSGANAGTILGILAVLGIAAIALINLARRSRIVPEAVDNTGYAAIAASSDPEAAKLGAHHLEGTGAVIVQEDESAPAPIKIMPIQREYANEEAPAAAPATLAVSTTKRSNRGGQKSTPAPEPTKTALKRTRKAAPAAPVSAAPSATPTRKKPPTKPATEATPSSGRTRMVPVPTINVPSPEETQRKRIVVSEIKKMVVKKPVARKGGAVKASPAPAVEPGASSSSAPAANTTPAKRPAARPKAKPARPVPPPQITIPEFEEASAPPQTRTVLRLSPGENTSSPDEGEPRNS